MERPILFNTEMVKAILEGRKTQTRRLVKQPPVFGDIQCDDKGWYYEDGTKNGHVLIPPYVKDDIMWVRETWADIQETAPGNMHYKASATRDDLEWFAENGWNWRPSIHMPREAARLFLKVKKVRIEHLNDIRLNGCLSEGVQLTTAEQSDLVLAPIRARGRFAQVWDSTLKPVDIDRFGWEANPWVWVIEFERMEGYHAAK